MNIADTNKSLSGVRVWLGLVMGMIVLMVAVGGITRLTESGLSMVTWEPILGTIPPMSEAQWQHRFDQYKQFPEFKKLRPDMSLDQFKSIFFWEYFHRLLGRMLGLVYALPLFWFWVRGVLRVPGLKLKLLLGLLLGGGQGLMGWYMVKSGLVDNPLVSHYRLAAHLGLAFMVFFYLLWIFLTIFPFAHKELKASKFAVRWAYALFFLLVIQIVWGAFVAGLNAGYIYNTFPTMQGHWIPPFWNHLQPLWKNFVDNPATVQLIHRVVGTTLGCATLIAWALLRFDQSVVGRKRLAINTFTVLMIFQFWVGLLTLLLMVPVALATIHQVTACLLLGTSCFMLYTFCGRNGVLEQQEQVSSA